MRLLLASGSPRRKELLIGAGVEPVVLPPDVDEDVPQEVSSPGEMVVFLARRKIEETVREYPDDYILGADTVVYLDGEVLGKPTSEDDAKRMLAMIAGRTHWVYTGIALHAPGHEEVLHDFDATQVTMGPMTKEQIDWYVSTGEPMDKAGSYALQGVGGFFVEKVLGDFSGVIGLPLPKVRGLLRRAGREIWDFVGI